MSTKESIRIIVVVQGGVVTGVCSSSLDVDVEVMDHDDYEALKDNLHYGDYNSQEELHGINQEMERLSKTSRTKPTCCTRSTGKGIEMAQSMVLISNLDSDEEEYVSLKEYERRERALEVEYCDVCSWEGQMVAHLVD